MTQNIFIGVDGGATKCKVRIEDEDGELIGQAVSGPANICLSVDKTWESIYHAIEEALKPAGMHVEDRNLQFHMGLGLAGCEVVEAITEFLNRPHPFATIELTSDSHAACLGAHQGKEGAILIVGTGVVGYQIQGGKGTRVGGWGFPHDDEGSGAWLGLEAVRLTFQWLDGRAEKSPLAEDVFNYFNNEVERMSAWTSRANSSEYARLAPFVINHSQQEEIAAVRLMKKAAHAVDRVGFAMLKLQQDHRLPCCLFGGIAPFIEPWLDEELRACLAVRKGDANAGAILMVREQIKQKCFA